MRMGFLLSLALWVIIILCVWSAMAAFAGDTTLYDKEWSRQGTVSESGNVYDRDGHRAGFYDKTTGGIYDADGRHVGSAEGGRIYDKDHRRTGSCNLPRGNPRGF